MDLNELQILVGRVKDNWKFAHIKGTSALHVLDRFSISLQVNIILSDIVQNVQGTKEVPNNDASE